MIVTKSPSHQVTMSNFYHNISGCIKYNDEEEALNWLSKASSQLSLVDYEALIIKLDENFPCLFKKEKFSNYKVNVKSLSERKIDIENALKEEDYKLSARIYATYFTAETYPEYISLISNYKKQNHIRSFRSSIKNNLSPLEDQLRTDVLSHLQYPEMPFFRRVQVDNANFYITKNSTPELSTLNGLHSSFARHLSWDHPYSREILSTELGESGSYGTVSLIGNYTPKENDLVDVSYFTASGRNYYSSAVNTLMHSQEPKSKKVDIDNFMSMKEVIPTASQMKAIYADGNYIIDGPAGTGKSTTLLQKLLILTTQKSVKNDKLLVLVKHRGLVDTFNELLINLGVVNIQIDSVERFLKSSFGAQFDQVSFEGMDKAASASNMLNRSIDLLLNLSEPTERDISCLQSSRVDTAMILPTFKSYCQLMHSLKVVNQQKSIITSNIVNNEDKKFGLDLKLLEKRQDESSLARKLNHTEGLKISSSGQSSLKQLASDYDEIKKILDTSNQNTKKLFKPVLGNLEKKFISLEETIHGDNHLGSYLSLGSHIQSKIKYEIEEYEKVEKLDLARKKGEALKTNADLIKTDNKIAELKLSIKSTKKDIRSMSWGEALVTDSALQSRMMHLNGNVFLEKNKYQTIIIDEAQDVPGNYIELVGFYSEQLILAGDEAQKENVNGLGKWANIRSGADFYHNGKLSVFKLRHNFRQTYELGNLSYNYRQVILGNAIENLEGDYFENQKGFKVPSIVSIHRLNELVSEKLKYISDSFEKKFPLVVISSDTHSQEKIMRELSDSGFKVSADYTSNDMDVLIMMADKTAGREFPVVISMLSEAMENSTVYIILSRAKFDLTLVIPSNYHIDANLKKLIDYKILSH